jgi:O-antigen/teichoic acid export membrane protein
MFVSARVWQYVRWRHVSLTTMREMLRLSMPIVPSSISLWVVNLSNRIVIGGAMGLEANGIYAVANKIPNLFSMAYTTFNLAWTESATLAVEQDDQDAYYSRMTNQLIRFLTGVMLLLIAVTPVLFRFFINEQYREAFTHMPILFFGVFFSSMVSFYGAIYVAIRRTAQVGVSSAMGALLNIAINLLLIRSWGLYAASVSTAVSYLVICLYRMYDLNRVVKIRYDVGAIVRAMLCFAAAALLCCANAVWSTVLTLLLAIVYNVWENGPMLLGIVKMLRRRCG